MTLGGESGNFEIDEMHLYVCPFNHEVIEAADGAVVVEPHGTGSMPL